MKKIKELLKGLITEDTSVETAEHIGVILNEVERAEAEHNKIIASHEDIRKKYIIAIQQNSFSKDEDTKETEKTITLEGIIDDVIKERKD